MFETILERFQQLGILDKVVIIGSWAAFLYRNYFFSKTYGFAPKTTDVDFLVPLPCKIDKPVDLPEELKDLNYIVQFSGQKGYIKLGHPELSLEFLVPELGRGSDKPYPLNNLGINAQPLRYVNLLLQDVIVITHHGMKIKVPHPTVFVLQKLLVLSKRMKEEKKLKDIAIIKAVISEINNSSNNRQRLKEVFDSLSDSWKKKIIKQLRILQLNDVLTFLSSNPHQQAV